MRVFADRSIVHPELVSSDSLALPHQAEKLEAAIEANQQVVLLRYAASGTAAQARLPRFRAVGRCSCRQANRAGRC